ncbi:hypothetical protein [Sinorhizobium fredii]|uniref:Uncharacterized protein n=1 Tax=Sinorhizobium fredii (strain USDA 257) TaxID=1185652 RepID=I3X551_SINF2|nr:hypothetical protein [Sinorhizobium fredii]AFL51007.1 hypothetical protein USDA257_c24310 [Sinorhizobium fredii USDA 257]
MYTWSRKNSVAETLRTKRDRAIFSQASQILDQQNAGKPDRVDRQPAADQPDQQRPVRRLGSTDEAVASATKRPPATDDVPPSSEYKRIQLPDVAYYRDADAHWIGARVPDHPTAHVNMIVNDPGKELHLGDQSSVEITDIYRGTLPRHGATELAARVLEHYGVRPSEKLIFRAVENESALVAHAIGLPASQTKLAQTGDRILGAIGLRARDWEFVVNKRGGLDIVGHIARSDSS